MAMGMAQLFEILDPLPPKHKLILLDTCFSGFLKTHRALPEDSFAGDARLRLWKDPVTQVLTAGRDDQYASEDPKLGHGFFSWAVLQGLRGHAARRADGLITFDDLAAFVRNKVAQESCGQQDPQAGKDVVDGMFFFVHLAEQEEARKRREQVAALVQQAKPARILTAQSQPSKHRKSLTRNMPAVFSHWSPRGKPPAAALPKSSVNAASKRPPWHSKPMKPKPARILTPQSQPYNRLNH